MKKFLFVSVIALFFALSTNAQEIGIRGGNIVGGNVAVDFAWAFKAGRLHSDLSFGNGVGVEVLYDFLYKPIGEGFYFYVGLGAYILIDDPFKFGIPAEGGVEYRFGSIPIAIGIDWRPAFTIIDNTDFNWDRFGINARFVF